MEEQSFTKYEFDPKEGSIEKVKMFLSAENSNKACLIFSVAYSKYRTNVKKCAVQLNQFGN
jgi:hypothetical protein